MLRIYTVKTYQMDEALAALAALKPDAVFSVANGVMKNEQLRAVYGAERVLGCMANVSGELGADGEVEFTRNVRMPLGPLPGYRGPAAADIAAAIDAAGVITPAVDDIETAEWSKFRRWLAMFALAVQYAYHHRRLSRERGPGGGRCEAGERGGGAGAGAWHHLGQSIADSGGERGAGRDAGGR